jgi:putative ABC transport system permease protein
MSVIGFVDSLGRDLRHALRTLPRRPTFTFAAILTLALGLGATTAIFSVVYSVLLKPLPYPSSAELVRIRHSAAGLDTADMLASSSMYQTYRAENRTFAEIGFWSDGGQTLTRVDGTERVRSLRVTYGLLQALGVQPVRGRWFTEAEHGPAAEGPAPLILSYAFAQSRFGSDAAALGRELLIDGRPSRVVGIMPSDFRFLDLVPQADVIVAVQLDPARESIGGSSPA